MPAALAHSEVVLNYLQKIIELSCIFLVLPKACDFVHTSSIGVIIIPKKKKQSGKWRLIVDLSSPSGASINDYITRELASLTYFSR